ncbi:MAG: hypothetical protein JSS99_14750 [Actinobacteria bacterium]|nr:hypothetical protein [Actinomycetota bacterium]
MRAEYDSRADALSIDLASVDRWDRGEGVDADYCTVSFAAGEPANIELIAPRAHLDLLTRAAERYGLDAEAIEAAARSALAAPDRVVVLDVRGRTQP